MSTGYLYGLGILRKLYLDFICLCLSEDCRLVFVVFLWHHPFRPSILYMYSWGRSSSTLYPVLKFDRGPKGRYHLGCGRGLTSYLTIRPWRHFLKTSTLIPRFSQLELYPSNKTTETGLAYLGNVVLDPRPLQALNFVLSIHYTLRKKRPNLYFPHSLYLVETLNFLGDDCWLLLYPWSVVSL